MMINSPILFLVSLALGGGVLLISRIKQAELDWLSQALLILGLCAVSLGMGQTVLNLDRPARWAVVCDVSPSCRGATYLQSAQRQRRVAQLLGRNDIPLFAMGDQIKSVDANANLSIEPVAQTRLSVPPDADAVLFFSDGQLAETVLSKAFTGKIHPAIDPNLAAADDSAVERVVIENDKLRANVRVSAGQSHQLRLGAMESIALSPGRQMLERSISPTQAKPILVQLDAADLWPENDSLSITPTAAEITERWLVGGSNLTGKWIKISPDQLPADATAYLKPSCIVLANLSIDQLSLQQQKRLEQYVRDLGGTLIIAGGDHAFAAGFYEGSRLDAISPLASSPPSPQRHWVLLSDASGSMSAAVGDSTRFKTACDALRQAISTLPPGDLVSIGGFSDRVSLWISARRAAEINATVPSPIDVQPHGPTNLSQVMDDLSQTAQGQMETHVVVLTDAEAELSGADSIAKSLLKNNIHLHAVLISPGKASVELGKIAAITGGSMHSESNALQWGGSIVQALRSARPKNWISAPTKLAASNDLPGLQSRALDAHNQTWLRDGATALNIEADPLIARWQVGFGQVVACAFAANAEELHLLADRFGTAPADPRVTVNWEFVSPVKVTIDAIDNGKYLNDLNFTLKVDDQTPMQIMQAAPGRYSAALPISSFGRLVTVFQGAAPIARQVIPGRYATEFDQIGINRPALESLARTTGGKIVEPDDQNLIAPVTRVMHIDLTAPLLLAGMILIAIALIRRFW